MTALRRDQRSAEAQAYRHWYKSARWQHIRRYQLQAEPLCATCAKLGQVTAAIVCDHIEPHRGDEVKFFSGPFQSLCTCCHNSAKQAEERRGYSDQIGVDGWPIDPKHPANR